MMYILKKLLKQLSDFTWVGIFITLLLHVAVTYTGLYIFSETDLLENFLYFYAVTASTVGYGDFSPVTDAGKYLVALWVIPGGIALFTSILGKIITSIQIKVRIMKDGMGNFKNMKDHVVVVGYKQGETEQLFRETEQKLGKTEKVVVCTDPVCNHENWVRAETFTDQKAYERANITGASRVVIMLPSDGETTNSIMAISSMLSKIKQQENTPNVVAYIQDERQAELIRNNFPFVECVVSNKVSYIARSLADPGISEVFEALSSSLNGYTLYSHTVSRQDPCGRNVDDFEKSGCSVIAVKQYGNLIFVNNHSKIVFSAGTTVYYVAKERKNSLMVDT